MEREAKPKGLEYYERKTQKKGAGVKVEDMSIYAMPYALCDFLNQRRIIQ